MKLRPINKTGKGNTMLWIVVILLGVIILGVLGVGFFGGVTQTGIPGKDKPLVAGQCSSLCPSDTDWTGTVNLQNTLNKTGAETFDATMYFFDSDGSIVTSITDTSAGSVTLTCGQSYKVKTVSTTGNSGDSSFLSTGSVSGDGKATADGNGNLDITVCGSQGTLDVQGYQHGLWEVRAYDISNNAYLLNGTGTVAQATSYVPTSQTFGAIATNASTTNQTIGSGGELHVRLDARPTVDDNTINDRGVYVLVDMDTNDWNAPTVKIDGSVASDIKANLNSDEKRAYTAYEYVFSIPASRIVKQTDQVSVDVDVFALAGINPSAGDSPVVAFAPIGQYVSAVTVNTLKVGSAQDDSSATAVHTLQSATFGVA